MVNLRSAQAQDQKIIVAMIRTAGINPMALDWRHFLVAEESDQIIGIGQVKQHGDGSRELASIAVIPARQKQGVASAIIHALIARENGVLYLTCRDRLETFYNQFGFRSISRQEMTPYFSRLSRVAGIFGKLRGIKLLVMKREAQ